jgi:hypothetical protein
LPYALSSWFVPAATGGNLTVDSAPASAVTATTGTVNFSWAGLSTGIRYVGAISHSDDTGLIALTVVNVDTR